MRTRTRARRPADESSWLIVSAVAHAPCAVAFCYDVIQVIDSSIGIYRLEEIAGNDGSDKIWYLMISIASRVMREVSLINLLRTARSLADFNYRSGTLDRCGDLVHWKMRNRDSIFTNRLSLRNHSVGKSVWKLFKPDTKMCEHCFALENSLKDLSEAKAIFGFVNSNHFFAYVYRMRR